MLERQIGRHAEGIQIAKIECAAFLISKAMRASTKGQVGIQPAVGCNIKLCPVMSANIIGRSKQAGLPSEPAHRRSGTA